MCLDGVHSDDTSTEQMDGINVRNFKVHRTITDKEMSVTGKLHIHGRLRETLDSEHNEEIRAPVDEKRRGETTMSEYMAQCNYKKHLQSTFYVFAP